MSETDSPSPPVRPRFRGQFCLLAVVVGCVLQLTVRDWTPFPVSSLYYALPRPVILILAIVGGIICREKRVRWRWAGLVMVLVGWIGWCDVVWHGVREAQAGALTVVFWNVGHDLEDDVAVVNQFLDRAPAILGLVETGPLSPEWLAAWRVRHPDYQIVVPHPELLLAVRGRVVDQGYRPLADFSHAGWVDAEIAGRTVRAVVVDIASNPVISRREPLSELSDWLHWGNEVPQVVMGDFNTPDESVWFAQFRPEFREVFRTAGRGYAPTWPWPAPVLKLDHIWVNRQIDLRRAWQTTTWHSDHRPQWAEITPANQPAVSDN